MCNIVKLYVFCFCFVFDLVFNFVLQYLVRFRLCLYCEPKRRSNCRGGVENTRLEAKAKVTKKFRGQGMTLSRSRTKDTDRKCSPKKRSSKFFFRRSQKTRSSKFFSGEIGLQKFFSGDLYLRKQKKRSLQIFRKVSGFFQRNFNGSKIMLSLSRGQANFRGLEASRPKTSKCVLEAKDILEDSTSGNCSQTKQNSLCYITTHCK